MSKINAKLYQRLEKLINAMHFELLGCELFPQGRQLIFRIYIDSSNGVTIDDCGAVSNQVSAMLDVEDPIQSRYSLEVSSPGIDRPLFKHAHYEKVTGGKIKIKLHGLLNDRRQFKGILKKVTQHNIYLLVEGSMQEIEVPFDMIEKANLIGEINSSKRKRNG